MTFALPFAGSAAVHGLFVALGLVAAGWVFVHEHRRTQRHDHRIWLVAGGALIGGAIGERLGTWLQHLDFSQNLSLLDQWIHGNRSILAALCGAWLGVHLAKKLMGYQLSTGDLFAPAVALGMAIGRIGCLLTELPGTPTGGNWGIVASGHDCQFLGCVAGEPMHPSFIYEIVFHAVAFWGLWINRGRLPKSGDAFIMYVASYAVFRFLVEFVRGNRPYWSVFTGPQVFLALTLPLLIWRAIVIIASTRHREGTQL